MLNFLKIFTLKRLIDYRGKIIMHKYGIIADIGGTNARFALVDEAQTTSHILKLKVADYDNFDAALHQYYTFIDDVALPKYILIDVAGPVKGDYFSFTNSHWSFSICALKEQFNLEYFHVVNDFAAIGLALPHLSDKDIHLIKASSHSHDEPATKAAIGPGTGLGMVLTIPNDDQKSWTLIPSEGGHATMAAINDQEDAILQYLRTKFAHEYGHVSVEKVVSGMGLENIYEALWHMQHPNTIFTPMTAPTIAQKAQQDDPLSKQAVLQMCDFLGTAAGSLAVQMLTYGGIYIAGGIIPKILPLFKQSGFIAHFEQKGRQKPLLEQIPVYLITHDFPAFLGLAAKMSEILKSSIK